jgi:hypothetical protein
MSANGGPAISAGWHGMARLSRLISVGASMAWRRTAGVRLAGGGVSALAGMQKRQLSAVVMAISYLTFNAMCESVASYLGWLWLMLCTIWPSRQPGIWYLFNL